MKFATSYMIVILVAGALELHAQSAESYFEKGRIYHTGEEGVQDIEKALSYYKAALKRNGVLYPALYNSGLIYHQRQEYALAQTLFIKAAKAAADSPQDAKRYGAMARNGLGSTYQKLGKKSQAEKQFGIAKRLFPSFVEAHYNHINLLLLQDRAKEARKALLVAEKLAPSERYGKFKGRLKVEEKREDSSWANSVLGIAAFIVLLWLYSLFLRRQSVKRAEKR
jgi:tetratricopeptide (TPR) repeat protein